MASLNIYNSNGTLLANRVVEGDQKTLTFNNLLEFKREVIVANPPNISIVTEEKSDLFIAGLDGGATYIDLSGTERVANGVFSIPAASSVFGGTLAFDPANLSANSFAGVQINSGVQCAKIETTDGVNLHNIEVFLDLIALQSSTNPVNVKIGNTAGTISLPKYADEAAATLAGLPKNYLWQTDGTGAERAGIVSIKQ